MAPKGWVWLNAVAVTAVMSFGACATGTDDGGAVSSPWAAGDAGDGAPGNDPPGNPGADGGSSADQSTPNPPSGDDSGQPPPTPDSAVDPGSDSSVNMPDTSIVPPVDSGSDSAPTGTDSGSSALDCPVDGTASTGLTYKAEWLIVSAAGGTSCSTGPAACGAPFCCFVPVIGGTAKALCVTR